MTPWLDDGDVTLYHGDSLETVRAMPDESVDCVVTSPPYWGLRDYGTGEWDGGDPDCDHKKPGANKVFGNPEFNEGRPSREATETAGYRDVCGKCGARRVDRQMGLEPTPDLFVAGMVELFREIRRVLAPHGTCWVNLGDSYAANRSYQVSDSKHQAHDFGGSNAQAVPDGLKPKDLVGIPWRVAFALQADGWWLRSDIIWAKPNPMPESVTDRPTKAHEYVFLLTKQPRYWFDTEAVREPSQINPDSGWAKMIANGTMPVTRKTLKGRQSDDKGEGASWRGVPEAGRNVRSVWNIATQPYPEAHFATFPEELARRCILAGCPVRVCRVCGKPSERIVDVTYEKGGAGGPSGQIGDAKGMVQSMPERMTKNVETLGWSDCGHDDWRPGVTLDPFIGSGTVAKVARDHQRHAIGIDLNETYLELAARRLQQLSLLT